jgi:tyrosyl-tRNA synthetase
MTGGPPPSPKEQVAVLARGASDLHVAEELEARIASAMKSGVPLRVKAGFDPTRPDLHVGHAVVLAKMRQFQEFGHKVILLVGDFTAMVGDPTGASDLRPRLTRAEVMEAAATYTAQAFKVLDKASTEIRYNSEWLDKLTAAQIVELMAKMTVSRMFERNDFSERFAAHKPIYQHEFLYPLLQAYDSVALACDIELGGTDQLWNLLLGRDLMPKYGLPGQMVLTTPLLEGTDAKLVDGKIVGKKMSKSAGNTIGLLDPPLEMYRKVMQVDDHVIFRYFELLSTKTAAEVKALEAAQSLGGDPRQTKAVFARELVERLHDRDAASKAEAEFGRVYAADAIPDDVPSLVLTTEGETLWLAKALSSAGLVKSTGEGKRLVEQGGVEIDHERVSDSAMQLVRGKRYLVKVGSKNRRFAYITVAG